MILRKRNEQSISSSFKLRTAAAIFASFLALGMESITWAKHSLLPKLPIGCFDRTTEAERAEWRRKGYRVYPRKKNFDSDDRRIMLEKVNGRLQIRKLDFTVCEDRPKQTGPFCQARQAIPATASVGIQMEADKRCREETTDCSPETGEKNIQELIRGKVGILLFTTSGCASCKALIPSFADLYDQFKGREGIVVMAIVNDPFDDRTGRDIITWHSQRLGRSLDFQVYREDKYSPSYITGYPAVVITNKGGDISAAFAGGGTDLNCQGITNLIERLLAEP